MVLFLYLLYISEKGVRREPTGGEDGVVVVTHTHTYIFTHTHIHTHTYISIFEEGIGRESVKGGRRRI